MATTKMAVPKVETIDGMDKWEVEEAARTLTRAFEIRGKSKLFKAALGVVQKQKEAAQKVQGWAGKLVVMIVCLILI